MLKIAVILYYDCPHQMKENIAEAPRAIEEIM